MGLGSSKPATPDTAAKKVKKAVDKAADKTSKAVDKAADKVTESVNVFTRKVEKALDVDKDTKQKVKDAAPVVGAVAVVAALGYYLWKNKPWQKKGGAAA